MIHYKLPHLALKNQMKSLSIKASTEYFIYWHQGRWKATSLLPNTLQMWAETGERVRPSSGVLSTQRALGVLGGVLGVSSGRRPLTVHLAHHQLRDFLLPSPQARPPPKTRESTSQAQEGHSEKPQRSPCACVHRPFSQLMWDNSRDRWCWEDQSPDLISCSSPRSPAAPPSFPTKHRSAAFVSRLQTRLHLSQKILHWELGGCCSTCTHPLGPYSPQFHPLHALHHLHPSITSSNTTPGTPPHRRLCSQSTDGHTVPERSPWRQSRRRPGDRGQLLGTWAATAGPRMVGRPMMRNG